MSTSVSLTPSPLRILVIKLRHHGDMLLISPVLSSLQKNYPTAQIDVLLYAETRAMLEHHPAIHRILLIDRQWKKCGLRQQLKHEFNLLRDIRHQHYDLVLNLADQWRSAILTKISGATQRIGLGLSKREGMLWSHAHTTLIDCAPLQQLHTVEQNLAILAPLDLPQQSTHVTMAYADSDRDQVQQHLAALNISPPYIVIQPSARWFFKCWQNARFAQVIDALQACGHTVILTSGPDLRELTMVADIQALCKTGQPASLSGQLSLPQLAALIDQAALFIGVDSVPMHMAAALQTPLIALFGPTKLHFWRPWQARGKVIWAGDYGPLPDPDTISTHTDQRYLDIIPAEDVIQAAKELLHG
ncbi:MAG: putative lipopolysaccharide heptosyltransferase III [Plesiomonas sp.]|uniref:putative lipopolysaccharide heptosyltransferase III n=1 Tax=Plesiomonas sp. TaxID=2486279 RepID=UPI003F2E766E